MPKTLLEFRCPNCSEAVRSPRGGRGLACPRCRTPISVLAQFQQLLDQWYYPRRWRVDVLRPTVHYIIEKLWTANGQGEKIYQGVSPPSANYDVFRGLVTRLVARGVDEGWVDIIFPDDPLIDDPVYRLEFRDAERFVRELEKLFPEVDFDEPLQASAGPQ